MATEAGFKDGKVPSYRGAFIPSASDTVDLPHLTTGISFSTAGAFTATMADGQDITFPSGTLIAGVIHPLQIIRLKATAMGLTNPVCYY